MGLLEAYLYLFFDSFFSALILPIKGELVYKIMLTETVKYSKYNIYIIVVLANMLGTIANFWIGRFICHAKYKNNFDSEYQKVANFSNRYLAIPLLLIAIIPQSIITINNAIAVFIGFLRYKFYYFLPIIATIVSVKYYYLIFY